MSRFLTSAKIKFSKIGSFPELWVWIYRSIHADLYYDQRHKRDQIARTTDGWDNGTLAVEARKAAMGVIGVKLAFP